MFHDFDAHSKAKCEKEGPFSREPPIFTGLEAIPFCAGPDLLHEPGEIMKTARTFARRTNLTPDVMINRPPGLLDDDEMVLLSVSFLGIFRMPNGWLTVGGPATGKRGEEFVPAGSSGRGISPTA